MITGENTHLQHQTFNDKESWEEKPQFGLDLTLEPDEGVSEEPMRVSTGL